MRVLIDLHLRKVPPPIQPPLLDTLGRIVVCEGDPRRPHLCELLGMLIGRVGDDQGI